MTWLKVFKGEGDRGFVGILGLSHGALVLGLTCSWSGTSFSGSTSRDWYEVVFLDLVTLCLYMEMDILMCQFSYEGAKHDGVMGIIGSSFKNLQEEIVGDDL